MERNKLLKLLGSVSIILFLIGNSVNLSLTQSTTNPVEDPPRLKTSKDNLQVDFTSNHTSMGRGSGILANLTLTNSGTNPINNVSIDFGIEGEYALFSPTYSSHQEQQLLNQGANSTFNIEVMLNSSASTSYEYNSADVVILFDASGSMSEEIESVRSKFLEMTDNLQNSIADLRMGMIVYGWGKYSEYPASSVNNYVELTSDLSEIYDLLNELYASGGTEPWGDAFAVIKDWEWRPSTPKLAIIVGDEDCDPGNIVGVGESGSYYNGTQLVDAITSLKEKGIQINSVITSGGSGIVDNQFHWIAEYTEGECVYLEDIESGEEPMDLPELIEHWTLEMVREFFVNLTATIHWIETDPINGDEAFTTTESMNLLVDLAPPSITVSSIINPDEQGDFELEVYAKPFDLSGIEQVNIYWTDDLFDPGEPNWHFEILEDKINQTYYKTFTNLQVNDIISFYIEASDKVRNVGKTVIYNQTITLESKSLGTITEFYLLADDTIRTIFFDYSPIYEMPTNTYGYLRILTQEELDYNFLDQTNFEYTEVYVDENQTVYQIEGLSTTENFALQISGDESSSSIKIEWTYNDQTTQNQLEYVSWELTEFVRTILIEVTISSADEGGYLQGIPLDSELVFRIQLFDEDWNALGTFTPFQAIEVEEGAYFVWIEQINRFGDFSLPFSEDEPTENTDPYYTVTEGTVMSGIPFLSFCIFGILALFSLLLRNKKRRKFKL